MSTVYERSNLSCGVRNVYDLRNVSMLNLLLFWAYRNFFIGDDKSTILTFSDVIRHNGDKLENEYNSIPELKQFSELIKSRAVRNPNTGNAISFYVLSIISRDAFYDWFRETTKDLGVDFTKTDLINDYYGFIEYLIPYIRDKSKRDAEKKTETRKEENHGK